MRKRIPSRPDTPEHETQPSAPPGTSRRDFLKSSAAGLVATAVAPATVAYADVGVGGTAHPGKPIMIQEQGSFAAGGSVLTAPGVFDPKSTSTAGNTVHGDHCYVQYQIPPNPRQYPLVMLHGGGQMGKTWEQTVDGREGYQTIFLRRGFSVYILDQPRRGRAGQTTVGRNLVPAPRDQELFVAWRLGIWPNFYPNTAFPNDPESLNQFFRMMTVDTGPGDRDVITDGIAAVFERTGPAVLLTHSASGILGWLTAIKQPKVKAIYAYEPTDYAFPDGEVPAPDPATIGSGGAAMPPLSVPAADFKKLASIPIVIEYSDGIPTSPSPYPLLESWRHRVEIGKQMRDALNRHGGDASIVHLPEVGLHGNTHFSFADRNNVQVADLLSQWLHQKGLDRRGRG